MSQVGIRMARWDGVRGQRGYRSLVVITFLTMVALVGGMLVSPLSPLRADTRHGDVKLKPVADTYVNQAKPSENYNDANRLIAVDNDRWGKEILMSFLLPEDMDGVETATLSLFLETNYDGEIEVHSEDGSWDPNTVNYTNRPGVAHLEKNFTPQAGSRHVMIDISEFVQRSPRHLNLAIVARGTSRALKVSSAETMSSPELDLSYGVEPPQTCDPESVSFNEILVPDCGVLWGTAAGAWSSLQGVTAHHAFEAKTERKVGIYHGYHRGDQQFPSRGEINIAKEPGNERVLFLNWKVAQGMTWADVVKGKADARIDREAAYLKAHFTDPFFLAPHHEPEDEVRTGSNSGMTARDWSEMFRYTIERLRSQGVNNVISTVSLMGFSRWAVKPWFDDLYPGDDVVDWMAWDPYAYASTHKVYHDFAGLINETDNMRYPNGKPYEGLYNKWSKQYPDKPLMLSEWGVFEKSSDPGGPRKANFFRSVQKELHNFPAMKALIFFEIPAEDNLGFATRIDDAPGSLEAFRALSADSRMLNPPTGGGNQHPVAQFTENVSDGTVEVDGSESSDPDGSVASYEWDFGDGHTATGATATHDYAVSGHFTIRLKVIDNQSAVGTSSKTVNVVVPNAPPTADFTATVKGLAVDFDGSKSADSDGSIAKYEWDYGDGQQGTGVNSDHTYASGGDYQVTLKVTDNHGATGSTTKAVTAVAPNRPPRASFTIDATNLTVNVDGSGSTDPDGTIESYDWDFGDGNNGSGETTSHTYKLDGRYTITLTVTDNQGATDSFSKRVTVIAPPKFVAEDGFNANKNEGVVTIPSEVRVGDTILLYVSGNNTSVVLGEPEGPGAWNKAGDGPSVGFQSHVYWHRASTKDAGKDVTITADRVSKIDIRLVAYRGLTPRPIAGFTVNQAAHVSSFSTPIVDSEPNQAVAQAWLTKSSGVSSIQVDPGATAHSTGLGRGGGRLVTTVGWLDRLADGGNVGGHRVTLSGTAARVVGISILLNAY